MKKTKCSYDRLFTYDCNFSLSQMKEHLKQSNSFCNIFSRYLGSLINIEIKPKYYHCIFILVSTHILSIQVVISASYALKLVLHAAAELEKAMFL